MTRTAQPLLIHDENRPDVFVTHPACDYRRRARRGPCLRPPGVDHRGEGLADGSRARAYGYRDRPAPAMHPGVGVEFHSGARANLPFVHTARPGQGRGRNAFQLQSEF